MLVKLGPWNNLQVPNIRMNCMIWHTGRYGSMIVVPLTQVVTRGPWDKIVVCRRVFSRMGPDSQSKTRFVVAIAGENIIFDVYRWLYVLCVPETKSICKFETCLGDKNIFHVWIRDVYILRSWINDIWSPILNSTLNTELLAHVYHKVIYLNLTQKAIPMYMYQ